MPEGWATTDTVSAFKTTGASEGLFAGTKALALDASGDLALLGGADGAAGVYSVSQQEVLRSLKAQDGAINDVAWAGRSAVTASSEGVVRVWNESGSASAELKAHAGEVLALAAHPSETLLASVGSDKSWVLYDLEKEKAVVQIYDNNSTVPDSPAYSVLTGLQSSRPHSSSTPTGTFLRPAPVPR